MQIKKNWLLANTASSDGRPGEYRLAYNLAVSTTTTFHTPRLRL